ncbi:hypothetical protein OH77DRAFT_64008 [Trametes cingulata]|nr:hypothetical protein OH77DRAFT_64008 [Trametes cingulata]
MPGLEQSSIYVCHPTHALPVVPIPSPLPHTYTACPRVRASHARPDPGVDASLRRRRRPRGDRVVHCRCLWAPAWTGGRVEYHCISEQLAQIKCLAGSAAAAAELRREKRRSTSRKAQATRGSRGSVPPVQGSRGQLVGSRASASASHAALRGL